LLIGGLSADRFLVIVPGYLSLRDTATTGKKRVDSQQAGLGLQLVGVTSDLTRSRKKLTVHMYLLVSGPAAVTNLGQFHHLGLFINHIDGALFPLCRLKLGETPGYIMWAI
jgi:hypothetical protein